jgi:hypothetical protein
MSRTKGPRKHRPTHTWTVVQRSLFCALGGHDVPAGQWVRFRIGSVMRMASCEACLNTSGIERPQRKVTMNHAVNDVRARQAGSDE